MNNLFSAGFFLGVLLSFSARAGFIAKHTSSAWAEIYCSSVRHDYKAVIPFLAPKNVRKLLESKNWDAVPGLKLMGTSDQISEALQVGLNLQSLGNESLVYHVDALVFLAQGKTMRLAAPASFQAQVYALFDEIWSNRNHADHDYFDVFQSLMGLRTVVALEVMGRGGEAECLFYFIESQKRGVNIGNTVHVLRQLIRNTGNFSSVNDSIKFCERVRRL